MGLNTRTFIRLYAISFRVRILSFLEKEENQELTINMFRHRYVCFTFHFFFSFRYK